MTEGVPREWRATTCRGDGSERRPTDPTVDLQKQIAALTDAISHMGVLLATLRGFPTFKPKIRTTVLNTFNVISTY